MKVYLDEDLSQSIVVILRRRGVDATSAHEAGTTQLGDRAQLEYATREGRAIITRNVVDFIALARDAVAMNTGHAGIVLVSSRFRGDEYQAIADAIVAVLKPYAKGLDSVILYVQPRQS